ncbi:MAG: LolA family protein [Acidithiobacillus sp.]|uniref:LolA family protein n=1 Tax=Acidithiobacillus sp. TaxID=1872118 RepID=UPI003D074214
MAKPAALRQLLNIRVTMILRYLAKTFLANRMTLRDSPSFPAWNFGADGRNICESLAGWRLFPPRFATLLALMALSAMLMPPAQATEWNIDQLMRSLAQTKSGHAGFVEKKFITMLEKPLESSGRLRFIAPDTLEMHTLKPKTEVMLVQGDTLTIDHQEIHLQDHPELLAFIDSIRGTLTGNRQMLEQFFSLSLNGSADAWTLTMLPKQKRVADVIQQILVNGSDDTVTSIEIVKTNHDRSLITIVKLAAP